MLRSWIKIPDSHSLIIRNTDDPSGIHMDAVHIVLVSFKCLNTGTPEQEKEAINKLRDSFKD